MASWRQELSCFYRLTWIYILYIYIYNYTSSTAGGISGIYNHGLYNYYIFIIMIIINYIIISVHLPVSVLVSGGVSVGVCDTMLVE